jgi:hypothetical protein
MKRLLVLALALTALTVGGATSAFATPATRRERVFGRN